MHNLGNRIQKPVDSIQLSLLLENILLRGAADLATQFVHVQVGQHHVVGGGFLQMQPNFL